MSLAHACVAFGQMLVAQNLGSANAVSDVWLCAVAMDAGSVDTYDANVVKHGSLKYKVGVDV